MKRIVLVFVVILCLSFLYIYPLYGEDKPVKIGIVNIGKALNESNDGIKASEKIKALQESKQAAIDKKIQILEKIKKEITEKNSTLSKTARSKKEDEIDSLNKDIKRMIDDANIEITNATKEVTNDILKNLQEVIDTIAKEEKYTMIISSPLSLGETQISLFAYYEESLDITNKVKERYNKNQKPEKTGKPSKSKK